MFKQVDKLVGTAGLCLLVASWLLATEKTAQAQHPAPAPLYGFTCLYISGDGSCAEAADTACQYAYDEYGDCSGGCVFCDSDTIIEGWVCVQTDYDVCYPIGGSVSCEGDWYEGECTLVGSSYCLCMYLVLEGDCDDGPFTYYYC